MRKTISLFLLCCMLLTLFTACGGKTPDPSPTEAVTDGESKPDVTVEPPISDNEQESLDVKWNSGYVGSANGEHPNEIFTSPNVCYSYSDVITVPKAGTKIYFADDDNGKYASDAVYVISLWRETEDGWEIDPDAKHYAGSGFETSDILRMYGGKMQYVYITGSDEEHIRLCYRSEQTAEYTPEFPKVYARPTDEEPTSAVWNSVMKWVEEHKKEMNHTALNGLTVNLLGDSYFAGSGLDPSFVWPALMAKKYGMTLYNGGVNGSTISNYVTTNNAMCVRYKQLPDNNPDIVLFEGGRNDYNKKVPLGDPDSTDTKTFYGALNTTISGLRQKYPNAVIVCITNWNFTGTNDIGLGYADYAGAMMKAAERHGVFCMNASDPEVSGVDMSKSEFKKNYTMGGNSVSHLNLEGMKLVLPYFESYLNECYHSSLEAEQRT